MVLKSEIQKKAILKDSLSSKEYAELKIIVNYSTGGLESLLEISARLKKSYLNFILGRKKVQNRRSLKEGV